MLADTLHMYELSTAIGWTSKNAGLLLGTHHITKSTDWAALKARRHYAATQHTIHIVVPQEYGGG